MAFDLDVVESEVRELPEPVKYAGQELNVSYRPAVISTKFAGRMRKAEKDGNIEGMAQGASELICGWDMTRRGEPVEPDYDTLSALPIDLLGAIFGACLEDSSAGDDTKK